MLYELASIGHLPLPVGATPRAMGTSSLERDVAAPPMHMMGSSMSVTMPEQGSFVPPTVYVPLAAQLPRSRPEESYSAQPQPTSRSVYGFGRTLPTYTVDLGRLPVFHPQRQQQQQPGIGMYRGYTGGSGHQQEHAPPLDEDSSSFTDIASSTSSWYPAQTSAAPFGFPDFAVGGDSMPTAAQGLTNNDIVSLFGTDALAFAEGIVPTPTANPGASSSSRGGGSRVASQVPVAGGEKALLTNEEMAMWANAPMGLECVVFLLGGVRS